MFKLSPQKTNNILVEDSGVSVFRDGKAGVPPSEAWKMACSNAAYASADGLRWRKLPFAPVATDDTKPTALYSPSADAYVVYVRRDNVVPGQPTRTIGRRYASFCRSNS